MDNEINLLKFAFNSYNLDTRDNITESVLNYIESRIIDNKENIEELIKTLELNNTYDDIINAYSNAKKDENIYKKSTLYNKFNDDFYIGKYYCPKGLIAVETDDICLIIKYFVEAIKSRNAIAISKIDYNEISLESLILIIFCEALAKFQIDKNLLMIIPFEECYYESFDEAIVYNDKNQIEESVKKPISSEYIIYLENENFKNIVENEKALLESKGLKVTIIQDDFEYVINEINNINPIGAAIYTNNSDTAYQFINLVHSKNVFVNATLLNSEDEKNDNNLYINKKIIYPIANFDNVSTDKIETQKEENIIENKNEHESNNIDKTIAKPTYSMQMIEVNKEENVWYKKIINAIKKLFRID